MINLRRLVIQLGLVTAVSTVIAGPPIAKAQSVSQAATSNGPSLKVTIDWLKGTLEANNVVVAEDFIRDVKILKFESCTLEEKITTTWNAASAATLKVLGPDASVSVVTLGITLSDLDPSAVVVSPNLSQSSAKDDFWIIALTTTGSEKKIQHSYSRGQNQIAKAYFYLRDKPLAERVANAFRNAIKLCGGKLGAF